MNFRHPTEVYFIFTVRSPSCGRSSAGEGKAASGLTADKLSVLEVSGPRPNQEVRVAAPGKDINQSLHRF